MLTTSLSCCCAISCWESCCYRIYEYDLNRVSVWCDLWAMKLNANKIKTIIVSRSRTVHPQFYPIDSGWNCAEGISWPCHIAGQIWCEDDLWETFHSVSCIQSQSNCNWCIRDKWHRRLCICQTKQESNQRIALFLVNF